jgi:hypothetical protein
MASDDDIPRKAILDNRIAQFKRWGAFVVAAMVLLPRPLAVTVVLVIGAVYMFVVVFF